MMATYDRAQLLETTAQRLADFRGIVVPKGVRLLDHYTGFADPVDDVLSQTVAVAVDILLPFDQIVGELELEGSEATRRYVEELDRRRQLDEYVQGIIDRMPAEFTSWGFNEFRAWLDAEIQQRPSWPGVSL